MVSRLKDTILGNRAYGRGVSTPLLNGVNGGQFGFGADYPGFISNTPYARRNLIAILVDAPRGFRDLDEPDILTNTLKSLVELHSKRIDGLQSTLTVDTQGTPFGGAGEQHEVAVNVTRQQSNPQFVWDEKYGRTVNRFFEYWITNLIMDPNTKVPNVMTRTGTKPTDLLPDYNTMTVIFIEPDPTHRYVTQAWLCANMMPKTGGERTGRKDQTTGGDLVEQSIEFTSITQVGTGVDRFAQSLLDKMNLTGANPLLRPAFVDQISADVKAGDAGYAERIATAGRTAIQP